MLQVIGGQAVVASGELRAVRVGQLLSVELHWNATFCSRLEYALGLLEREADAFAKGVDGVDQSFIRKRRQHDVTHLTNVVVTVSSELRRHGVRAQECGAHLDRAQTRQLARRSQ